MITKLTKTKRQTIYSDGQMCIHHSFNYFICRMKKLLFPSHWIVWGLYKTSYRVISIVLDNWKEWCWLAIIRGKVKCRCHMPAIKFPWKQILVFQTLNSSRSIILTRDDFNTATPSPLTVWITINCGKFWKRWEYQTTWPASWEICMQVRKQQVELDMEQQTCSK